MKEIRLRYHHVMCIHTYSGHGYDEKFAENIEKIIKIFKEDPNINIRFVDNCDDICKACPNRNGEYCSGEDSIREKDNRVKKYFDLDRKSIDTYKDLVEEIKATLSELQDISEICGQCDFKKLCNKVLPKNI